MNKLTARCLAERGEPRARGARLAFPAPARALNAPPHPRLLVGWGQAPLQARHRGKGPSSAGAGAKHVQGPRASGPGLCPPGVCPERVPAWGSGATCSLESFP